MLGKCMKELRQSQEQMIEHLQGILTGDTTKIVDYYRELLNQQIIVAEAYVVLLKDLRRFARSAQNPTPPSPAPENEIEKVEVK